MTATSKSGRAFPSAKALYGARRDFLWSAAIGEGLTHTLGSALAERGVDLRSAKDAMQKRILSTALHYSRRVETQQGAKTAIHELDE